MKLDRIDLVITPPKVCTYLAIEADGENGGQGGEAVLMAGSVVGTTSSVVYGHSVE